jgi:hypothetical protein
MSGKALEPVQSKQDTTQKPLVGGVTGKGFMPGQSGNPGGRKRSLERRVRELVGDDGDKIASFLVGVLTSEGEKTTDRLEAARLLMDRGWGKPAIALNTDGEPTQFVLLSAFGAIAESDQS